MTEQQQRTVKNEANRTIDPVRQPTAADTGRTTCGVRRASAIIVGLLSLIGMSGGSVSAQETDTLTINATVAARAELTITPTTINFPDASPTTTPSIPADSTVTVTARVRTKGTPTLTVRADGDLVSGGDSIAISNVTWTASAAPFVAGTMSSASSQDAATFSPGSGQYTGTFSYSLANSWAYAIGSYTQTAVYTLTAP